MTRQPCGRQIWMLVLPVVVALAIAAPTAAQEIGRIRGKVLNVQGEAVEGADVTIEEENTSRQWKTKSDRNGEFTQIGLRSGNYMVTAEKEGVGAARGTVSVRLGRPAQPEMTLIPAGVDPAAAADPEALAKVPALSDQCSDCYYNVGVIYTEQKKYSEAETAFKKAIEVKPDYADAYNGLANVYNAQRMFDEAGEASAKAAELSGAGLLGVQAMILFNSGKGAEAKPIAEQALAMDANNADAHFIMGMILLTEDPAKSKAELETFLSLTTDQSTQNATTAKALIPELDKMIQK